MNDGGECVYSKNTVISSGVQRSREPRKCSAKLNPSRDDDALLLEAGNCILSKGEVLLKTFRQAQCDKVHNQ
ncbi:hypothetical protein DRW42_16585 [Pedobacter miscanthi]|uniref:Uncharacterized protein n=1 Tax=Pedobacter miscanthi TaxID=2259170 RepID=A0A366KUJ5_9SPHI|nr:hypothetical protein DRW42_16585 [Pedobacter miscanthi]